MKDNLLLNLGVCTNEVHPDLETALRFARDEGIHNVELLEFWGKPVTEMSGDEIERAREMLERFGMHVRVVLSESLYGVVLGHVERGKVGKDAAFKKDLELLQAGIRVAKRLGAPVVGAFAFRRDTMVRRGNPSPRLHNGGELPEEMLTKVVEGLRIASQRAADAGLLLGLENVRSCWANTGFNTGKVIRAVDHPAIKAIWDPANDYVSGGVPYPDGYDAVKPFIVDVHVKDARVVDNATGLTAWEAVGRGEVDYINQFRALRRDGYTGTLSLETHWSPPEEGGGDSDGIAASRTSLAGIRSAFTASLAY